MLFTLDRLPGLILLRMGNFYLVFACQWDNFVSITESVRKGLLSKMFIISDYLHQPGATDNSPQSDERGIQDQPWSQQGIKLGPLNLWSVV